MEREYIKIKKRPPLPNSILHQKALNDDIWKDLVFYHLLNFYKNYDSTELKQRIQNEQKKDYPRPEREIAKFVRKQLNNEREFSLCFRAFGENTNDEDVEGSYDITIHNTYRQNDFYFECKNLDRSQDLINKYVSYKKTPTKNDGGIYRYFNGKYAQNQNFGGMLGFVLDGKMNTIIQKIIEKMKKPFDIAPEGNLLNTELNSIERYDFTFNSIHERKGDTFKLHHLLFDFQ